MEWPPVGYEDNQITPEADDLLKGWLPSDPEKRLGSKGISAIKDHPFFKEIDWKSIRDEIPPFVPQVKNDTDTQHFR
jgi:hypothetical protein